MAHLCRLILLVFATCFAVPSHATIPMGPMYAARVNGAVITGNYSTPAGACNAASSWITSHSAYPVQGTSWQSGYCPIIGTNGQPTGGTVEIISMGNACPENSASNGSGTCSCTSGFVEKNGACVAPDKCDGLASYCSSRKGSSQNYALWDSAADTFCYVPSDDFHWDQPKYPGCNQGCMGDAIGMTVGAADSTGRMVYRGEGRMTGGLCTEGVTGTPDAPGTKGTDKNPAVNDKDCAGFKGTVNGQVVCIPASSASGVDWTGTTSNSDGTKSESKTSTTCSNGVCETTKTTTNKDAAGNTTGTTTSTERHSQLDYCSKNPTSQVCAAVNANPVPGKDSTGSGNGNGTGGGTGGGNCNISNCSDSGGGGPGKVGFPGTGAGGEIGQLYQPKYPDGPVKLWNDKSATLKSSGLGSLAIKLFPQVPAGGTPPQWIVDFDFGVFGNFGVRDISPPSWLWDVCKAIVLLTALITARRLIFGG